MLVVGLYNRCKRVFVGRPCLGRFCGVDDLRKTECVLSGPAINIKRANRIFRFDDQGFARPTQSRFRSQPPFRVFDGNNVAQGLSRNSSGFQSFEERVCAGLDGA